MGQFNAGMGQSDPGLDLDSIPLEPAKWPKTLGVFSIVLGSMGVLANACGSCFMLAGPSVFVAMIQKIPKDGPKPKPGQDPQAALEMLQLMGPWMMAQGALMLLLWGTSVWLLIAGVQMARRKSLSVGLHQGWAWTRIGLSALLLVVGIVSTVATAARQAEIDQTYGGSKTPQGVLTLGIVIGVLGFVLFQIYPVIVLVVLSKPWAKAEVARWGARGTSDLEAPL